MHTKSLLISFILMVNCVSAQLSDSNSYDSLSGKSCDYLRMRFDSTIYDRVKSKIYVTAWLKKARAEKKNDQLALAYKGLLVNSDKNSRLKYADSMIVFASETADSELIGSSYLTKGIIYYDRLEHLKALENYLIADKYISQIDNPYLTHKIKYGIAHIKYYLGFYDEAISLLKECINYFKDENDRAYLNSLHCIGLCYNRIGNYEDATSTNRKGIDEGRLLGDRGLEFYFIQSEGINECCKGNYTAAIRKLNAALPNILKAKDVANESASYFYLGKSYWSVKQYGMSVLYFKKVDHVFLKDKFMRPDFREAYERLIDYYRRQNNTKMQLSIINRLLVVDKFLSQEYKHLLTKVVKDYDTKELLAAKEAIERRMLFAKAVALVIFLIMALVIGFLIKRNIRNKKTFAELMSRHTGQQLLIAKSDENEDDERVELPVIEQDTGTKLPALEISPEIEEAIVKKLEKFELNKKYLEKDMTLAKMAVLLHTNSKYVTKIIAKHRGKGTIDYITHLKIDYIIELLKADNKFRNYTNKALGEEAGFGSTQNFTRAFKSYTGITPTYFIYKLKKAVPTDSFE